MDNKSIEQCDGNRYAFTISAPHSRGCHMPSAAPVSEFGGGILGTGFSLSTMLFSLGLALSIITPRFKQES